MSLNTLGLRKERTGLVVSDRMQKTVVVSIERTVVHPMYKKILRRRSKVKAHDESNECRVGDRVLIVECRPLSRDKRWRVSKVLEKGHAAVDGSKEADA
jgi:small subunit ribosomal protein S17